MSDSLAWLVGRGVFNPDASFVGKIIAVRMGMQSRPTLLAQTSDNTAIEIEWASVAGGKDILVLKPGFDGAKATKVALPLTDSARAGWDVGSIPTTSQPQRGEAPTCPTCGNKASWIGEYGRWFCRTERKYL